MWTLPLRSGPHNYKPLAQHNQLESTQPHTNRHTQKQQSENKALKSCLKTEDLLLHTNIKKYHNRYGHSKRRHLQQAASTTKSPQPRQDGSIARFHGVFKMYDTPDKALSPQIYLKPSKKGKYQT